MLAFIYRLSDATLVYYIGTTSIPGSITYEHIRFAVERFNSENMEHTDIKLEIAAPANERAPFEEKSYQFVSYVGPSQGQGAKATNEFIEDLRWTSFFLAYERNSDISDLAPLIYHRRMSDVGIRRPGIRIRVLPNNTDDYEPFLKFVKNRLKQTNIIIHSSNITTLYNLLQQARGMNMTEQPFSYVFTNTDLALLEDFLNNVYGAFHCNITGLQLVKNDPMMKMGIAPRAESIVCDRHNFWREGRTMNDAIRKLHLRNQLTGEVKFTESGEREDLTYLGVGRINSQFVKVV
ncbi:hypothetical protein WR25_01795 [Diploscapter pachys]|uniref:Receptor ligand binding region domain-containing protein n=1 Tax=Diploscapter pachys TaxID=2018661 RepID=A0A2A2LTX1_9BILA|nr:hypothetical protein WR25_01795 [Diploscapter pachys]